MRRHAFLPSAAAATSRSAPRIARGADAKVLRFGLTKS